MRHRLDHLSTKRVEHPGKAPFRIVKLRCSCGITMITNWWRAWRDWHKHVDRMDRARA